MKKDGLDILLFFAVGPLEGRACGNPGLTRNVFSFLGGEKRKREEIIEAIPGQLKTAWSALKEISQAIGKPPLSMEAISLYVLGEGADGDLAGLTHNALVKKAGVEDCSVFAGRIKELGADTALVEAGKDFIKIRFFSLQRKGLEPGDLVAFHWRYLICRLTREQFKRLSTQEK